MNEAATHSIQKNSKSFALAALLLPKSARAPTHAVYAWCRRADDAIDQSPAEPMAVLGRLRSELDHVYASASQSDAVLNGFAQTVRAHGICRLYPSELLSGMEMDATDTAYESWDQLLHYCYRVASTVGLMMCQVLGVRDGAALRHAAHLGLAMQLTNICRDVLEDWQRGRLYLPEELLGAHGLAGLRCDLGRPLPTSARPALARVMQETLQVADQYYRSADLGLPYLTKRCAFSVAVARWVYAEIGRELERNGYDVFAPRAVVSLPNKLRLCGKAALQTLSMPRAERTAREPLTELSYGPAVVCL